jgi:hypothetical protein
MYSLLIPTQQVSTNFGKDSNKLNYIHRTIKRGLILRVACYHSIQNLYRLIHLET